MAAGKKALIPHRRADDIKLLKAVGVDPKGMDDEAITNNVNLAVSMQVVKPPKPRRAADEDRLQHVIDWKKFNV